ncbi:TPA: hypothetical protein R4229_003999 [Morganella morganii]|nr:hypothetical protein [Morganella morganii]
MNDTYYAISPSNNNDSCVYMTTDNHEDFTTLPPEAGKTIIYFTSKKLAEKYIKNTKNDDKLCVREIKSREVNRLEWICCYDYNIPFKINGFAEIILLGVFMSGIPAFFIWAAEGIEHRFENLTWEKIISYTMSWAIIIIIFAYVIKIFFINKTKDQNNRDFFIAFLLTIIAIAYS